MPRPAQIAINLLPKDPFLASPLGRLMSWATSVGRYLVIFTELMVVLSFASRFSLDRQITDLNTSILQRRTIIESFGDLEQNVRTVQRKIDQYEQVRQQTNLADVFPKLTAVAPIGVRLDQLQIRPTQVNLTGEARTQESLNALIANLQRSEGFSNVVISSIDSSSSTPGAFNFRIQAELAKQQLSTTPATPPATNQPTSSGPSPASPPGAPQ